MKMHLVALAGLASGFAVFSGCASGGFTSTSGQQQNTPVKANARNQTPANPNWVDWTKPAKDQGYMDVAEPYHNRGMP